MCLHGGENYRFHGRRKQLRVGRPDCLQGNRIRSGGGKGFPPIAAFHTGADRKRTEGGLAGGMQWNDAEGSREADRFVAATCESAYPVGNGENKEEIYGNHVSCRNTTVWVRKNKREEEIMPEYGISVREILKKTVIVEAGNVEEAIRKTEEAVERDEVILDVDDFDDREIVPLEYWEGGRIPDGEDVSSYWQLDCRK